MLLFRSPQAEQTLSANNYAALVEAVLGDGLKTGVFTEADKQAYIAAWSQPGALTGGLNYYRAANLGPPAPGAPAAPPADSVNMLVKVPTLVIWGEKDTALADGKPGRHGQVRAEPDHQAHPGRVALGDSRKARAGERLHSRVHSLASTGLSVTSQRSPLDGQVKIGRRDTFRR